MRALNWRNGWSWDGGSECVLSEPCPVRFLALRRARKLGCGDDFWPADRSRGLGRVRSRGRPTLRGGFVYDSIAQVLHSDYLHTPSHWVDVLTLRVVGQDELDRNRPLHLASLMLDAPIWGKEAFGYRQTSVLLHALNATLVFVFSTIVLRGTTTGGPGRRRGIQCSVAVPGDGCFLSRRLRRAALCFASARGLQTFLFFPKCLGPPRFWHFRR
jgi:hypothetical protein